MAACSGTDETISEWQVAIASRMDAWHDASGARESHQGSAAGRSCKGGRRQGRQQQESDCLSRLSTVPEVHWQPPGRACTQQQFMRQGVSC